MKTKKTAHKQHGINAANKTMTADDQSPSHSSVVMTPFARNKSNVTNTQKNELSSDHIERHETYHPCSLSNSSLLRDVRGDCGTCFGGSTMSARSRVSSGRNCCPSCENERKLERAQSKRKRGLDVQSALFPFSRRFLKRAAPFLSPSRVVSSLPSTCTRREERREKKVSKRTKRKRRAKARERERLLGCDNDEK